MTDLFKTLRLVFLAALAIVLVCMLFSSCYTPRKATRQVTRAQAEFPEVVARGCSAWYPVRAFDSVRVEYRQGEIVRDTAWVEVDCDSVVSRSQRTNNIASQNSNNPKSNTVRVPCPPSESRVDTFYTSHSRVEENTALTSTKDTTIARLNAALSAAKAKEVKTASGRNAWRITALISLFLIVATVAVRLWRPKLLS